MPQASREAGATVRLSLCVWSAPQGRVAGLSTITLDLSPQYCTVLQKKASVFFGCQGTRSGHFCLPLECGADQSPSPAREHTTPLTNIPERTCSQVMLSECFQSMLEILLVEGQLLLEMWIRKCNIALTILLAVNFDEELQGCLYVLSQSLYWFLNS